MKPLQAYWHQSKSPTYSLIFVVPLVLCYHALALVLGGSSGGIRNGADALLRQLSASLLGRHGPMILGIVLVITLLVLVRRDRRTASQRIRAETFAFMGVESALLAAVFGVVVGTITAQILGAIPSLSIVAAPLSAQVAQLSAPQQLMVSLGAGVYEELLFRVLLVSALGWILRRGLNMGTRDATAVSVVVAAAVFSLFHYIGPFGDPFHFSSFLYRFVAGLFFSGLYVLRGFGITAWTHALYDVYLIS